MSIPATSSQMKNKIDQDVTNKISRKSITPLILGALLKTIIDFVVSFFIPGTLKGAANGVASLDGTGKVPTSQLPSGIGGGGSNISDVKLVTASRNYEASDANKLLVLTGDFQLSIENDVPLCFNKGDQFAIFNLGNETVHFEKPNDQQILLIGQNEIVHFVIVEYSEIVDDVEIITLIVKPIAATKYDTLDSKLKTGFQYLLDNLTTAGDSNVSLINVGNFTDVDLNAAPADAVIYLPLTGMATIQSTKLIQLIRYTFVGASVQHLSLTATNDGLSPELWKNENSSGVPDNKFIQNMLDIADLTQEIAYLKIKFAIDESIDNPQDFSSVILKIDVQVQPILTV